MDNEIINKIFDKKDQISKDDINIIRDLYIPEIESYCRHNQNYWNVISKAPQHSFNKVTEIIDRDIYEKIKLKNEESSFIVDFFLGCVLGPLAGIGMNKLIGRLVNSQFLARLFTSEVSRINDLEGKAISVVRKLGDLGKIFVGEETKKKFIEDYSEVLVGRRRIAYRTARLAEIRTTFDEYGKDYLQGFGEALPDSLAKGGQAKVTPDEKELSLAETVTKYEHYSENQFRFFGKLEIELKRWLIKTCYEKEPEESIRYLKGFKTALEAFEFLKIDESLFNVIQESQESLLEAIFWAIMFNGKIFKFQKRTDLVSKENYYYSDISLYDFQKRKENGLVSYYSEPLVGDIILKRLIENFPHKGYPATDKKFKDFLKEKPELEVHAMMDEYFSLLFREQVIGQDILAIAAKVVEVIDELKKRGDVQWLINNGYNPWKR